MQRGLLFIVIGTVALSMAAFMEYARAHALPGGVQCEADPAHRPRIFQRDDRPRVLPIAPVATKARVKKICEWRAQAR